MKTTKTTKTTELTTTTFPSTKITHEQAKKLLAESNNIVNVKFIKKDNTIRSMNCRRRVTSYLHGGHNTTAHMPNIVNVFDMIKKEYRKINTDNILLLTINKKKFQVV